MSKKLNFWALMLLGILLCVNNAWGADATFTFSSQGYTNAQGVTSGTIDTYTSWSATKGTNAPAYYDTGSGLRVYNGGTFTVTSTKTIASITLTFSGTGYTFSTSNTTTPQTVTPNATSYVWSVSRTCRLQKIEITYSSGGSTYTVNFNANGGTVTPTSATQTSAGASISLPTPTYAGHSCTGWYTASSGGTKRGDAGGDYVPTSNETLYAQWVAVPVALTTMDQIYAKATEVQGTATDVTITFNNWVVTGVSSTGKNVYVTDGTKGFQIYGSPSLGFTAGDILSGTVSCKVELYKQAAQLTLLTSSTPGLTVTEGGSKTAETVATSTLGGVNTGRLVTYSNMTYNSSNQTLSDGSNSVKIYNQLYNFSALTNGKNYNITGVYLRFGDVNEILPRSAGDIEEKVKTVVSIAVTTAPKTSYTTCENLVLGDWVVTATYDDDSQENVTLGCTFSPADDAVLTVDNHQVTVTHTASGKQATQTITVDAGSRDTFIDNLHENDTQYGDCDNYTVPSLSDETPASACEGEHYHFVGWSSAQLYTGQHATEPAGLLKAGSHHSADGTTYYAVWAKEQH